MGPRLSNLLDWNDLEIALAVAEAGSISGGAAKLGKQQPTISARISHLEARLGVKIFTRSRNGTKLTEIGETIIQKSKIMESTAREIERMAKANNALEEGIVTIYCTDGLATYWIAPHLSEFMTLYPNIQLELHTGDTPPSVNSNQADIIVQFDGTKEMDAVAVSLGWLHYLPFTTTHYLERKGCPSNLFDALNFDPPKLKTNQHNRQALSKNLSSMDELISYCITTSNSSLYFEAMKGGAGIAFIPSFFAMTHPELVYLDYGISVPMQFWAVYNRSLMDITKNRVTLDWLRSLFHRQKHPYFRQEFVCPTEFSDIKTITPSEPAAVARKA